MTPDQLREEIIRPVIQGMGLWSQEAEDLLLGTAVHESDGLKRITQYGSGPALGYFQMEPDTLHDLLSNFLRFRPELDRLLLGYQSHCLSPRENLRMNTAYAVAACRLQYYRKPDAIPKNLRGQAEYWKRHWNTVKGRGTVEQYISHYPKKKISRPKSLIERANDKFNY